MIGKMREKALVCLLLATVFLAPISAIENSVTNFDGKTVIVNASALDGGWLEERNGVKILHVNGSNYDMGYQHGYLLRDEIEQNYRAVFSLDDDKRTNYSETPRCKQRGILIKIQ